MKKNIKRQIDWYLDFAQKDLELLAKGDVAKLIYDARDLVFRGLTGVILTEEEKLELLRVPDGQEKIHNLQWIQELQRSFLSVFQPMMSRIERLSEHLESVWKTYSDSKIIDGVTILEALHVSFDAEIKVMGPLDFDHSGNEIKVRASRDWLKHNTIVIRTRPTIDDKNLFIYGFVKCLPGIPTEAFKQCKECRNWFLHLTKRKREFCNNLCAARNANRRRRAKHKEVDPEKYNLELEKSRKRANKSYKRKIKKIHPNARIKNYRKK